MTSWRVLFERHFSIMIGIYKITNPEGLVYVGASSNIMKRINHYKSISCKGQKKLYSSIQKYGFDNHLFEVLEECDKSQLNDKECFYGIKYDVLENGLNSVVPKMGVSMETKIKMSVNKMGSKNKFYGKTHSDETKEKIRQFQTGRKHTMEHRMKVSKNSAKSMSKIVLDLSTGIFFNSIKEASICLGFNHSTLKSKLNGSNKNTTNLIIV